MHAIKTSAGELHVEVKQHANLHVMVYTDVGKDIDDALALALLCNAHHGGEVNLLSVVTNLKTSDKRAMTARAILDTLGCYKVPVGVGTDGTDNDERESDYEYNPNMTARGLRARHIYPGVGVMMATMESLRSSGKKMKVLCISSLRDIAAIVREYPMLFQETVKEVCIQGAIICDGSGNWVPDGSAANNRFDMDSARSFYKDMMRLNIPCTVATKYAAMKCRLPAGFIEKKALTKGRMGAYIRDQFYGQTFKFYTDSCSEKPYLPHMNEEWWVRNVTDWYERFPDAKHPGYDGLVPYIRVPMYDAIAALCLLDDWISRSGLDPTVQHSGEKGYLLRTVGMGPKMPGVDDNGASPGKTENFIGERVLDACEQP